MHPRKRLMFKNRDRARQTAEHVAAAPPVTPVVEKVAPVTPVVEKVAPQAKSSKKASATKKSVVTLKKK